MAGMATSAVLRTAATAGHQAHRDVQAQNARTGLPAAGRAAATPEQAQKLGSQFENMFLSQMLAPMFEGLHTEGVFGGGTGERMFRSFQIDSYAQAITRRGGVGIAQRVAREILSLQEKQNG
ncbi:MAG: rod-binding protein [Alphaproteobacteria bacterium]|nr:rod-binding protein [Alphaproteobacteria bacterium]